MMQTRTIHLGPLPIGGTSPISIQSMCNTDTGEVESSLQQIERLYALGCDIIRLAVPRAAVLPAFAQICARSPIPVIADIHFDYRLALGAIDAGAAGIRINPGNIQDESGLRQVARAASAAGTVIRVGVNLGSLSPRMESQYGRSAEAMVQSALEYCRFFTEEGCQALKVSLKASSLPLTVAANRRFAALSDIPLHLGVTEAGTASSGSIKSAIGIGSLLLDGIGSTIRVSLTAPPEEEVRTALRILSVLGLRQNGPELISCPTCGRTRIDLLALATAVEDELARFAAAGRKLPWRKIAVMGCEVNGPGEARDADIGIAGGKGQGLLFKHGKIVKVLPEGELLAALRAEMEAAASQAADSGLP